MADRREIDLIIKTMLQGKNNLPSLTNDIKGLTTAISGQVEAAQRGEVSYDQLRSSLEALNQAADKLKGNADLISNFTKLNASIEKNAEAALKAKAAYEAYKAELAESDTVTKRQENNLKRMLTAYERLESTLSKQRTEQEALSASLREIGVDTNNLAQADNMLRNATTQLASSMVDVRGAMGSYADDVRKARDAEKEMAAAEAFRKKAQDAQHLMRAAEYAQIFGDRLDFLEEKERTLAGSAEFERVRNQARNLLQAAEYAQLFASTLDRADEEQRQIARGGTLLKLAQDSQAAARGYKTMARSVEEANVPTQGLRATLDAIIEPTRTARATIGGLSTELNEVAARIKEINGPVEGFRDQMQQLIGIQRQLAAQGGLAEAYGRDAAALRAARAEYSAARNDVNQYVSELRKGIPVNAELEAKIAAANNRLRESGAALQSQLAATRASREAARAAGIDTRYLADATKVLTDNAKQASSAVKGLTNAYEQYGDATKRAGASFGLFNSSGRTTLSLLQRIRGEVLSMAAAYVGLYGAIGEAGNVLDAFTTKQGVQQQLGIVVGTDAQAIGNEYKYIQEQAERIGISFEVAARGYAKFSAAARLAGKDSQAIKYIFESFSEVGRVANLSAENMDGIFKALEQVISKGTIQAEELRGQLGDRLFGAFEVAAIALKDQFPDLQKAMKAGEVTADQLLKIAEQYKTMVADQLPAAMDSLAANQARLNSEIFYFRTLVAESGFAAEYERLVKELTEFMRSDDGKEFARNLSSAFGAVVSSLSWLINNLELVKFLLKTAFDIAVLRTVLQLGNGVMGLADKYKQLTTAVNGLTTAQKLLGKAFVATAALAIGFELAGFIAQTTTGAKAAVWMATQLSRSAEIAKLAFAVLEAEIPVILKNLFAVSVNQITWGTRQIMQLFADMARALGRGDYAATIEGAIKSITAEVGNVGDASAKARQEFARNMERIRRDAELTYETIEREANPIVEATVRPSATETPDNMGGSAATVEEDAKAVKARKKLREQLEKDLLAIEKRIARNDKDSLDARLEAIDIEFTTLQEKLAGYDGKDRADLERRLQQNINELKLREITKFNAELEKQQETLQTRLEQVDAKAGRNAKRELEMRLAAIKTQYADFYRDLAALREQLETNGRDTSEVDVLERGLDASVAMLQQQETTAFYTETLTRKERELNEQLQLRADRIRAIADQEKLGLITTLQARQQAAAIVTEMQPGIEALVISGRELAASLNGMVDPAKLELFIANLELAENSARGLRTELFSAGQVNEMFASGGVEIFTSLAQAIGNGENALNALGTTVTKVFADMLLKIGQAILMQTILNALQNSSFGGAMASAGNALVGASVQHTGGTAGNSGVRRMDYAALYQNAPRYHDGVAGVGLRSGEVRAILEQGEEVLAKNDPRNILNGGAAATPSGEGASVKILNMVDSASVLEAALNTPGSEKLIFNNVKANVASYRQLLGIK